MRRSAILGLTALLSLAGTSPAQMPGGPAIDWSQTVAFGDSLTDNSSFGAGVPAMPGLDPLEAAFAQSAAPTDQLASFALRGVTSDQIFDQILIYAARLIVGAQQPATTISLQAGTNDINQFSLFFRQFPPGANAGVDALATGILIEIADDLSLLLAAHPTSTFIVWTIPDVTSMPSFFGIRDTTEGANLRAHIERINSLLRLIDLFPRFVVLDTYDELRTLVDSPPTLGGVMLSPPPAFGQPTDLYIDTVHPTAVTNALLANALLAGITTEYGIPQQPFSDSQLRALAGIP